MAHMRTTPRRTRPMRPGTQNAGRGERLADAHDALDAAAAAAYGWPADIGEEDALDALLTSNLRA